ncbi:MAG: hypothetical protein LBE61_19140 [Burkholderiaceae bacterium]|jgi:hypothetical protein|nr:hypothetical protein [Burkholderiaceae bacterium]
MDVELSERNVLLRQCCAVLLGGCAPGAERMPWSPGRRSCCVQSRTKVKLGGLRNGKTRLAGLGSLVLQLQMETGGGLPPARILSALMPYEPWKEATITDPAEVGASLCDIEAMRLWKAIVETTRAHGHRPSHAIP